MDRQTGQNPNNNTGARRPVQDQQSMKAQPVGGQTTHQQPVGYHRVSGMTQTGPRPPRQTGTGYQRVQNTGSGRVPPVHTGAGQMPVQSNTQPNMPPYRTTAEHPPMNQVPDPTGDTLEIFDDIGRDPALKLERSKNLFDKQNDFWQKPDELDEKENTGAAPQIVENDEQKPLSMVMRILRMVLGVLILGSAIMYGLVLRVHSVSVVGNETISAAVVKDAAGLWEGQSIFGIDEETIHRRVSNNYLLIFEGLEKVDAFDYVIHVRERKPAAVMNYGGINYTIDLNGMVLAESNNVNVDSGMMVVTGVLVAGRSGCVVGRQIVTTKPEQMEVLRQLLIEIHVQSMEKDIVHVTVSDMNKLLVETRDGYSVKLGDSARLYAKLKALKLVRAELEHLGRSRGTIDVSVPETPSYIP